LASANSGDGAKSGATMRWHRILLVRIHVERMIH